MSREYWQHANTRWSITILTTCSHVHQGLVRTHNVSLILNQYLISYIIDRGNQLSVPVGEHRKFPHLLPLPITTTQKVHQKYFVAPNRTVVTVVCSQAHHSHSCSDTALTDVCSQAHHSNCFMLWYRFNWW